MRRNVVPFAAALRPALVALCLVAGVSTASADPCDPPATYYDATAPGGVPLVGTSLKLALRTIINMGFDGQSYGYARYALDDIDFDPNAPGNVVLVYNGQSVSGVWDSGATWNREHTWPRSLGVGSSGDDHDDLHQLRPCNPGINSSRGNKVFGEAGGQWDAKHYGLHYRGEMARAMFYMETMYSHLVLHESPTGSQMGDLRYLRRWHFEEAPDEGELARNQIIFDDHQHNRNPFVDRPEFVWAIWGSGVNDSTLHLGASPDADGASSEFIDVGFAIVGGEFTPVDVPLTKLGDDPTTFAVLLSGDARSPDAGNQGRFRYRRDLSGAIEYPVQQAMIGASLFAGSVGPVGGVIIIDNTDLTEEAGAGGRGKGARDFDDVLTITGVALAHAAAAFTSPGDDNTLIIDFGDVPSLSAAPVEQFVIHNLESTPGLTADLLIGSVGSSGDDGVLTTSIAAPTMVGAGDDVQFTATVATGAPLGDYQATYTINVADEPIGGAAPDEDLVITLMARIVPPSCDGDVTGDGATGLPDFSILAANFGLGPNAVRFSGDLTNDGWVTLEDFTILASDFGCTP